MHHKKHFFLWDFALVYVSQCFHAMQVITVKVIKGHRDHGLGAKINWERYYSF